MLLGSGELGKEMHLFTPALKKLHLIQTEILEYLGNALLDLTEEWLLRWLSEMSLQIRLLKKLKKLPTILKFTHKKDAKQSIVFI